MYWVYKNYVTSISKKYIFSQKFPAVANSEEEKENDDDDEEESLDDTVVDPEEVNVHDKLIWDYMCFIHCYVHVKWAQDPALQRHQYHYSAPGNMNCACVFCVLTPHITLTS